MTLANGEIMRVAARGNLPGIGDIVNVYHFRYDGASPIPNSTALTYASIRVSDLHATVNAHISNDMTYVDLNCFNVTTNQPLGVTTWTGLTTGGHADETLPAQVSAFVRGTTGYSRNWARKFIGPMTSAANTSSGLIESTVLSLLAAFISEWVTPTTGGGADNLIAVVHRTLTNSWEEITEGIARNVWATMRTRRAGRGS